ncbi:hypothetical protein L798_14793 [Zootermopsis nevadensis]|uniref:Uncharacterized protein n=2 Tax=Zootermopsis nevadensis TaxID=136037 RepID=A0A067RGD7_ZOONE|nr:hypothetical protein L798_14793 [Zootermopsis nevadensis]
MKSCLVFLFALGLTSATETTVKKLTVFGVPGVSSTSDTVGSSFFGLKSVYPYSIPVSANPFIPYNIYYPFVPNVLRSDFQSVPISIRDVYNKPVTMILKSKSGVEGLTAYILENGLSSLAENPETKFIHDLIKTGSEKTAVVVQPTVLSNTPAFRILKDMSVVKLEVPSGIKFSNLVNVISTNMPFVFIHDKEDVSTFESEGLVKVGSLDIADEKVVCASCF